MTTNATFDGLAFPVAKVRYTGSGYAATLVRDADHKYRARVSYDPALGPGAKNARRAAIAVFEKARADMGMDREDYVAVPGDLDAGHYVFTFVPAEMFA